MIIDGQPLHSVKENKERCEKRHIALKIIIPIFILGMIIIGHIAASQYPVSPAVGIKIGMVVFVLIFLALTTFLSPLNSDSKIRRFKDPIIFLDNTIIKLLDGTVWIKDGYLKPTGVYYYRKSGDKDWTRTRRGAEKQIYFESEVQIMAEEPMIYSKKPFKDLIIIRI
jgi:hypothetical protein